MSTLVDDLRAQLAAANARAAAAESDRDAALSQAEALTRALTASQATVFGVWGALGYVHTARCGDPGPEVAALVAERKRAQEDATAVPECTGIAARWCPNCGTCTCPEDPRGGRTRDRATCPLHGAESRHAEALCAGGCGEMVTDDGERCDACELRRLRAEVDALRAIVEGRTAPPTDAEIKAHDHNMWLVVIRPQGCAPWSVLIRLIVSANPPFDVAHSATPVVIRGGLSYAPAGKWLPGLPKDALRWWPLDQDGRPAQWPVATEASR